MTWFWVVAAGAGAFLGIPALWRWWARRAWSDPSRDPGASRVRPRVQEALTELVHAPGDPAEQLATGLALCAIDEQVSWRGGLRRLVPIADQLGSGVDADALRAELWLGLGEVARAEALCTPLPADHWRACVVRAGLYAIDGDDERADSALVAAGALAPIAERERIYLRLETRRRRRGLQVGPPLTLWERPPDQS